MLQTAILFAVFFATILVFRGIYVFAARRRLEAVAALRERMRGGAGYAGDASILRDIRKSAAPFIDRCLTGQ